MSMETPARRRTRSPTRHPVEEDGNDLLLVGLGVVLGAVLLVLFLRFMERQDQQGATETTVVRDDHGRIQSIETVHIPHGGPAPPR